MKISLKLSLLFLGFCFVFQNSRSQDLIIKTNGDTIRAKITEIGTNAVSYKKTTMPDGPTFVEFKSDISQIKFANGEVQQFPKSSPTSTTSVMTNSSSTTNTTAANNSAGEQPSNEKNKITKDGNKYTINGKKAKAKEVDRLMGKSKNPAILVPLKLAKATRISQKIVKITAIPSSIGGGFTTLVKVIDLYNDINRARDNSKTYVNFGLSLVGTMALPITSKLLKKKSDKMYNKLIDMYNFTN